MVKSKKFIDKRQGVYDKVSVKGVTSAPAMMLKNKFKLKSVFDPNVPTKSSSSDSFMSINLSVPDQSIQPNQTPMTKPVKMNPDCIRTTENWTSIKRHHRFDKPGFDPKRFLEDMDTMSPKLKKLIENIRKLDADDLRKRGKQFKHFIFSDVKKGGYGAKIISSGLVASGFTHCFTKSLGVKTPAKNEKNETFGLLSSTSIYDKVFTKKHIQAVTSMYNKRPDNVFGENMRFVVLDSGFKEGIDLFDVKYVHIFENQKSGADLTQAIGRATRTCGQRGLQFVKNKGWKLHVFQYYIIHEDSSTWFNDYMFHDGNDLNSLQLISNIEKLMVRSAVDHDLNYSINTHVPVELKTSHESLSASSQSSSSNRGEIVPIALKQTPRGVMELVPYDGTVQERNLIPIGFYDKEESKKSREIVPLGYQFSPDGSKQIVPLGYKFSSDRHKKIVPYGFSLKSIGDNKKQIVPYGYEYSVNGSKHVDLIGYEYVSRSGRGIVQKRNSDADLLEYKSSIELRNRMFDADSIEKMSFEEFASYINILYDKYRYKPIKIENLCVKKDDALKKDERIVEFSESQNFVTHYFIPNHFAKGLLVWHSVGTGKTCTAVSVKSFLFEKSDYSVIWVTRTTLKSDIWKNMYEQICDHVIREKALQGVHEDDFRRYMSKRFIPPMSYKQFSNVLEKKNVVLYDRLISLNGTDDILRNTLVIIDEAHKLYSGDLSANEKPKMSVIEHHVHKSKSCKLLLMTGTPVVKNPMEFSKMMNLIIKKDENKFPTNESEFKKRYLNGTEFTNSGINLFQNNVKGLISHLDKRFDPRQFAQPEFHKVPVLNSIYPGMSTPDCVSKAENDYKKCIQNSQQTNNPQSPQHNHEDEIYACETEIETLKAEKKKFKRTDSKAIEITGKIQTQKDKLKELKKIVKAKKSKDKDDLKSREKDEKLCGKTLKKTISECKNIVDAEKDMYQNIAFVTNCVSKKRAKRI